MRPTLHVVPDAPRRGIGMIRVSDERGRGEALLSPDIQRRTITDHAARSNIVIADDDWIEGIDTSGSRTKSGWWARLDSAIEQVERGERDVIVVWKFSRAARHRLKWAVALDRIESAGGTLESATEPNDASPAGRLSRGMIGEFAAYEAEIIGDNWKSAHRHRTDRGLPANGKPRWGYTYDRDAKMHRPDPETAPVLTELYRRYVAGESIYSLVRWLNNHGYQTTPSYSKNGPGRWADRSLRRVLDSGFAAGFITVSGELRKGAHEALIGKETWDAYLNARETRRVHRSGERSQYLLSGLVRCVMQLDDGSACGSSMTAGQFGHNRAPKYRCKSGREAGAHDGGYVMASTVEGEVMRWLREIADPLTAASAEASVAAASAARRRERDVALIDAEIRRLGEQLVRASRQHIAGIVPESAYIEIRDDLQAQTAVLEQEKRSAAVESRRGDAPSIARDLLADWDLLPVEHRRGALRRLISRVEVVPGRPRAQMRVVPTWE